MEIKQMLAHSSNYTKGRKQPIQYIVVHYTANNGDMAQSNGKYFAQPNRNASAHYFVDENNVVQSVLDGDIAWHCGAKGYKHNKCRNDNSIGVEMCSEKDQNGQYYINEQTQNTAIEVVKMLMKKYSVPLENVLRHYDVTGKMCPEPFVRNEAQWLDFKRKLTENITENKIKEEKKMIYHSLNEVPEYGEHKEHGRATIKKLMDKKAFFGDEKGDLNLSHEMLRIFVMHDRMGLYDR